MVQRILVSTAVLIFLLSEVTAQGTRKWYKGNLHTHSYWSDGDEFPEMIMDWYLTHGYHFVGLSDHNTMATGEKWKKISKMPLYENAFLKYLQKYGEPWVIYNRDSGRVSVRLKTFSEYKPLFENGNFLILPCEEITSRLGEKPIHVNATNLQTLISPQQGETVSAILQRTVDAVLKQREETGVLMFPHINHPNFYYGISVQDLIDLRGERFFEVYNGHPLVNNYGDSLRPGTEVLWDMINIAYHKRNQPLLYGLATDDSHNYHEFGKAFSNAGRGWVMVQADSLSPESLIRSMEAGMFYASTGVMLDEMLFNRNTLKIKVRPEPGITYAIEFIGVSQEDSQSRVLRKVNATRASFKINPKFRFVRARVTSSKLKVNPFQEGDYETAWTQPIRAK